MYKEHYQEELWEVGTIVPEPIYPPNLDIAPTVQKDKKGVVFTKKWVVDLILDATYSDKDIIDVLTVEPSCGHGAFTSEIVKRLLHRCIDDNRPFTDCVNSLRAFEIEPLTYEVCRDAISNLLDQYNINDIDKERLLNSWLINGDYLHLYKSIPKADFIVGNPPYIRYDDIDKKTLARYQSTFSTLRGRVDIYIAFFEAALSQLITGGVCTFICTDRWIKNQYGVGLRELISKLYNVQCIIELGDTNPFDRKVSTYPIITVISKERQGKTLVLKIEGTEDLMLSKQEIRDIFDLHPKKPVSRISSNVFSTWFKGGSPWLTIDPHELELLYHLESNFSLIESEEHGIKVGIGVATGRDDIFIIKDKKNIEESRLIPIATTEDIRRSVFSWSGNYLVNPWEENYLVDLAKYPILSQYLVEHKAILSSRHVGKKNKLTWFRTIDKVNEKLVHMPKLYFPDVSERLAPVLDRGETYPHHNLYHMTSDIWDLEVLGGILLTDVPMFLIRCYSTKLRGGYYRLQSQYLRKIRLPKYSDITNEQRGSLREAFRTTNREQANLVANQLYKIAGIGV